MHRFTLLLAAVAVCLAFAPDANAKQRKKARAAVATATAAALQHELPPWAAKHRKVLKRVSHALAKGDRKKAMATYQLFLKAAYQKRDKRVKAKIRTAVEVERWIAREAYLVRHPKLGKLVDKMRYHRTAERALAKCARKLKAKRKTIKGEQVTGCRIALRRKYAPGLNPIVDNSTRRLDRAGLNDTIKEIESMQETVRNKRQMASTSFQNFDQKSNQLYNLLSSVMKAMNEMRMGTVRNML